GVEEAGRMEEHRSQYVGAVRIAEADDGRWFGVLDMRPHEGDHLRRRAGKVRHVVEAFAGAPEISRRAMLRDIAARCNDGGAGQQILREARKLVLVAAGAVKR